MPERVTFWDTGHECTCIVAKCAKLKTLELVLVPPTPRKHQNALLSTRSNPSNVKVEYTLSSTSKLSFMQLSWARPICSPAVSTALMPSTVAYESISRKTGNNLSDSWQCNTAREQMAE